MYDEVGDERSHANVAVREISLSFIFGGSKLLARGRRGRVPKSRYAAAAKVAQVNRDTSAKRGRLHDVA